MMNRRHFCKTSEWALTKPRVVLFDLDGTLVDTADDLGAALNSVLTECGLPTVTAQAYRPVASHGAKGLLELGFGCRLGEFNFTELRNALLNYYASHIAIHSRCFAGVADLLAYCHTHHIRFGIVTNKPYGLANALIKQLPELAECSVLLGGDSMAVRKPHPAPLWVCCQLLAVKPTECWYVGDAERDIAAANRAGMTSIIADYGYIDAHDRPADWGADLRVSSVYALLEVLKNAR